MVLPDYTHHPDLWFEDGNVIFVVGTTLFRVYRGVLAEESYVFRDMFLVGMPGEKIQDCPVIIMNDPLEDMAEFLKLMFKGSYALSVDTASWSSTRVMLKFGDKYIVRSILAEGTKRLKSRFPMDIGAWDALYDTPDFLESTELIVMANIVRSLKLGEDLLRRVLYRCCQLSNEQLLAGHVNSDGTVEQLCAEDLVSCLDGRRGLLKALVENRGKNLWYQDCYGPCCTQRIQTYGDLHHREPVPEQYDPLKDANWADQQCTRAGVCDGCRAILVQKYRNLRSFTLQSLEEYIAVANY